MAKKWGKSFANLVVVEIRSFAKAAVALENINGFL